MGIVNIHKCELLLMRLFASTSTKIVLALKSDYSQHIFVVLWVKECRKNGLVYLYLLFLIAILREKLLQPSLYFLP